MLFRQAKLREFSFFFGEFRIHQTSFTTNVKGMYIVKKYKRRKRIYKTNHKQLRKLQ